MNVRLWLGGAAPGQPAEDTLERESRPQRGRGDIREPLGVARHLDVRRIDRYEGREHEPFQRAASYRNAYLTDLWQQLIDTGIRLDPVLIQGSWREIDTGQDLERARHLVESFPKEWS